MKLEVQSATLLLEPGHLVKLLGARGALIRCLSGVIWITEVGVTRDDFLQPGQSLLVRSQALTLIEALGEARIHFKARQGAALRAAPPVRPAPWVPYY